MRRRFWSEEHAEQAQDTREEQIAPLQRSAVTELYLSIFVLFARLGAADSIGGTAFNGVAGITFVQGFLGASGRALRFWYHFQSFSKRKQNALLWGAAAIVAATVLIFHVAVATYHRVFAIDPYFDF